MIAGLANVAIVVATAVVMELIAAAVHRYVMHGFGWGWHKSHHEDHDHVLERNDLFAVCFAALSAALFVIGAWHPAVWWMGVGTALYGLLYFIVHDGLVHQRWPFHWIPRRGYLKHLVQAHRLHHAVRGRDGAVSFGFLYAAPLDRLVRHLRANAHAGRRQE
jgi:beta-carotene 3-hydroxylase